MTSDTGNDREPGSEQGRILVPSLSTAGQLRDPYPPGGGPVYSKETTVLRPPAVYQRCGRHDGLKAHNSCMLTKIFPRKKCFLHFISKLLSNFSIRPVYG